MATKIRRTTSSQTQVQSRVNGLKINIPTDARGVIGRFASQGGNELVFAALTEKQKTVDTEPVKIDTSAAAGADSEAMA